MSVIGRLKPGLTLRQAQADLDAIARNLESAYPDADKGVGIRMVSLKESIVGDVQRILLLMLGAVGFVLLIACANLAGLLLARSESRAREFTVRVALGAGRARVIRQLLTESLLLAATGGGLGLIIAGWSTKSMLSVLPQALPRADHIQLDTRVLVFTLIISGITGLLFGLIPALKSSRANLAETFKEGGRSSSATRYRTQGIFVVAQMAVALVLLAGAGLMLRSLAKLWNVNPGFDPHHVLFFNVAPSPATLASSPAQILQVFRELPKRLEAVPGIEAAAALAGSLPMQGDSEVPVWRDGQAPPTNASELNLAMFYGVTPDYWKAMRVPLLRGRYLTDQDNEHSPPVVLIDENLAHKFFGRENPLGKRIHLGLIGTQPEIVGIVGHVKHEGLASAGHEKIPAQFYMPFTQIPEKFVSQVSLGVDFVARTTGPPESFIGAMREASKQFDSQQVVYAFDSVDAIVSRSIAAQHFSMILLSAFAALALLLSCAGIYGLLAYVVGQRTHEIGVRVALGAVQKNVLWLILGHGAKMTVMGTAIGLVGAFGLTWLLSNFLFGVSSTDPITFSMVAILMILVGLLASYVPARRAMRVDPMVALRYE
jgi:predicted permease